MRSFSFPLGFLAFLDDGLLAERLCILEWDSSSEDLPDSTKDCTSSSSSSETSLPFFPFPLAAGFFFFGGEGGGVGDFAEEDSSSEATGDS